MKECRSHRLAVPARGKILDRSGDPSWQLGGRGELLGVLKLLQPFDSELFLPFA
jgi:hypothetical protein